MCGRFRLQVPNHLPSAARLQLPSLRLQLASLAVRLQLVALRLQLTALAARLQPPRAP